MRSLVLFFLIFSISCQDSPPLISKVRNCCETVAIQAQVGSGNVYVPNIFTPDNDGINDLLTVFASSEITQINKIEIRKGSRVIFSANNFTPNSPEGAWDGQKGDEIVKGVFSVEIEVADDTGNNQTFTGEVCSFPCNGNSEKDKRFSTINCAFGTQHNGNGSPDVIMPTFEIFECIE
jgi:hypothetical protein